MLIREITEGVGRITKQNQTVDVGPDEVTKQAAKFGNKVDRDGRPPTLSKKVKGKSTNVLFNLGLAENFADGKVTELFDKPYPYTLDIGSDKATARISLPDETNLRVGFLKSKTKWDMAFDRDGTFDADDQGDQFKVMATVVAVFKDFVEKVKPAKITFDADQDSTNSRVDVYGKMLNRYANKMGYGFTAKNPEGDSIIQYTLTKGKPNVKNTAQPQKDVPAAKTSSNFSIKKIEQTMWDEFRIFNLHKAGKVDLVDAIAKLSPEEQEWAKLRWGQGLRLGEIGKKYNLSNSQAIEKYKTIHDKIRQHLGLNESKSSNRQSVEENFADGKVKGKSRPGRVKRSGASCNGSVTALRKRAKNASGEKAKMYHWCANMKSGKKK